MFKRLAKSVADNYTIQNGKKTSIDDEGIMKELHNMGITSFIDNNDFKNKDNLEVQDAIFDDMWNFYNHKIEPVKEQFLPIEKTMVLRMIDRAWVGHIDTMDKLRNGIGLRSYAQNNPLQAYVEEGFGLFEEMMNNISRDVVNFCLRVKIIIKERQK